MEAPLFRGKERIGWFSVWSQETGRPGRAAQSWMDGREAESLQVLNSQMQVGNL